MNPSVSRWVWVTPSWVNWPSGEIVDLGELTVEQPGTEAEDEVGDCCPVEGGHGWLLMLATECF